jgi:hypothetical protein
MKNKIIVLISTLFFILGLMLIINIPKNPNSESISKLGKSSIEIFDRENNFKMIFPDSISKNNSETLIAGINCKLMKYTCNATSNNQIELTIIKMPSGLNDTILKSILKNYFFNIEQETEFKAGLLNGLIYKTYTCGVPIQNFIGISGNTIYHYTETITADSLNRPVSYLNELVINLQGKSIKSILTMVNEQKDSSIVGNIQLRKSIKTPKKNIKLISSNKETELVDLNSFRIDIPKKIFLSNQDTVLYYLKSHYYAREHTFQKSIACNFEKGTSKETISYPMIGFTINLYENGKKVIPYQTIYRNYVGNSERK